MPKPHILFIALICLGWLCLGLISPVSADDRIPAEEARRRIQAHLDYINRRIAEMDARYDFGGEKSGATLAREFERQGAMGAKMYIGDWSNGVFMTWHDRVWPFYTYHANQLSQSLNHIQNGLAQSDMQYLDNGMAAWKQFERTVAREMQRNVELIAGGGKITSEVWRMEADMQQASESMRKILAAQKENYKARESARLEAMKADHGAKLEQIKNTRLFSAIGEQRIPLPPTVTQPMN